jgi:acetyl/propionyl-CoA carboxylase alpha subunit
MLRLSRASQLTTLRHIAHLGLKGPQAFLDASGLVRAAVDNGCDALHPGIGFLSESPVVSEIQI